MSDIGSAAWSGSLKEGKGTISTGSGALKETPYSFQSRFEGGKGANPEELIGAALASCYTMAMTLFLGMENLTADSIKTSAKVGLQKEGDGFAIKKIQLTTAAKIPGITPEKFQEIAEATKKNCPVSKVLNAEITLAATLE